MNAFTIKDLENLSGIKAHTIRIWEQRYSFIHPKRSDTNIRYYTNDELRMILNIALLNKYGFKISHINKMSQHEIYEKILSLSQTQAQQERIINDLIKYMIDLDLNHFESTLDNYILPKGIDKTVMHIIFPFLERVGILWSTNHINPAQEHLISNIIRQKLIVGIESTSSYNKNNKTLLLFLPEGEFHEMGLLFVHFLLKSRGIEVLYLGANVPVKDIVFVAKLKSPDFLYTHLICVTPNFNLDKYVNRITTFLPGTPLIVSGRLAKLHKAKDTKHVQFKRSLSEVVDYISSI